MSKVTMARDGASASSRGSWKCGKVVALTAGGVGAGPAGRGGQTHKPSPLLWVQCFFREHKALQQKQRASNEMGDKMLHDVVGDEDLAGGGALAVANLGDAGFEFRQRVGGR